MLARYPRAVSGQGSGQLEGMDGYGFKRLLHGHESLDGVGFGIDLGRAYLRGYGEVALYGLSGRDGPHKLTVIHS